MRTLTILLAHGSSDPAWSQTFVVMTEPVTGKFPQAKLAFMELSTPTLDDVAEQAAKDGIESIIVLPLFLATGKHLKKDIPAMLKNIETRLGLRTQLLPPIGEHPALGHAILSIIEQTLNQHTLSKQEHA